MKKALFLFLFLIINSFLYSQSGVIKFLSLGFNMELNWVGYLYCTYYFYGFKDYSEAIINDFYEKGSKIKLNTKNPGEYFPDSVFNTTTYKSYKGKNNSIGYYWNIVPGGGKDKNSLEYKLENNELVYWAQEEYLNESKEPYTNIQKIEQNSISKTIYYKYPDHTEIVYRTYYNIPKKELLDIFLKNYIKFICEIIDYGNDDEKYYFYYGEKIYYENNYKKYIPLLIESRTSRELEIFRNCIYAKKGYKFNNSTWNNFFIKYLDNYNGLYTDNEIKEKFTKNEEWLLNLVIKNENGR